MGRPREQMPDPSETPIVSHDDVDAAIMSDLEDPAMAAQYIEFRAKVDDGDYTMTVNEEDNSVVIKNEEGKTVFAHDHAKELEKAYKRGDASSFHSGDAADDPEWN